MTRMRTALIIATIAGAVVLKALFALVFTP